jgi:hypothetical protein
MALLADAEPVALAREHQRPGPLRRVEARCGSTNCSNVAAGSSARGCPPAGAFSVRLFSGADQRRVAEVCAMVLRLFDCCSTVPFW